MSRRTKKKNRRGFTLMETLVVVGLMVVLMAIAIPSVVAIGHSLQMSELDDTARQIALSVQNRLTAMKSTGDLDAFSKEMATYPSHNLGILSGTQSCRPADYPEGDDQWQQLYYLDSADPTLQRYLMGEDSVLRGYLESGSFVVELSPDTGDVYGVFYAKRAIRYETEIQALNAEGRAREERKDDKIGYYGGFDEISAGSSLPSSFSPKLEVINREDLYLKVQCADLRPFVRTQRLLELQLTLEDEGGHKWEESYWGGADFSLTATGQLTEYILLDSLRDGEHFSDITRGKLTAGDDLTITAVLRYSNPRANVGEISGSVTAEKSNSLFAKKTVEGSVATLEVGCLRHLNNLRSERYRGVGLSSVQAIQIAPIDADGATWRETDVLPEKPLKNPLAAGFPAIENTALRAYSGNKNTLRNFAFVPGAGPSGLFGSVSNCSFEGVRLVDCAATGSNQVGLLAGSMNGGTVRDCQAYLSTRDDSGRDRVDMDARVAQYCVKGSTNVGGLLGQALGRVELIGSCAAVNVSGASNIGGMVGAMFADGTSSLTGCYGSGAVSASGSAAGGLVGNLSRATVTNCYSSSDVTAPQNAGGLAGGNAGAPSVFTRCYTYGQVRKNAGAVDAASSGPFVSSSYQNSKFTSCGYLQQGSYNAGYSNVKGEAMGFLRLKNPENLKPAPPANNAENSHPYSRELLGNGFPFPLLRATLAGTETTLEHYGNWPAELTLQTSLVYYERYANGTYGYYAKTSLTGAGAEDGNQEANAWLVNTLRDEFCVEDGYAIMTIFKPDTFTYRYNGGTEQTLQTVASAAQAGTGRAALITSGASMVFRKGELTYTISNAHVYQLPFDLQITDRSTATFFYDQVKMSAYVKGRADPLFQDFSFYYCPDFAKNAINPDPDAPADTRPADPRGEESPVYVRSPRQLNGLGRATYYWNAEQTGASKLDFYFKQETDLDFGKYTADYCGRTYDLMDTSFDNPYRNRPIGRPAGSVGSQFRYTYDGCGKRIIDYCSVTYEKDNFDENKKIYLGYQFTGMFGEIRNATLKNINLIASDPDAAGGSTGYVESQHNDSAVHSGTGALVGLIYVDQEEEHVPEKVAKVQNCSVTGYEVRYRQFAHGMPTATGGLAGYNFGRIEQCTAVMKSVEAGQKRSDSAIGGLAGSLNGRGSITDSYAAGTLKAVTGAGGAISYGGVCGGYDGIFGYGNDNKNKRAETIRNSYSYCTWKKENLTLGTAYPVAPQADQFSISNCFYLTDTVEKGAALQTADVSGKITPLNFAQLSALALGGRATAAHSHPYLPALQNRAYPFPAVLTLPNSTNHCHYGDWPVVDTTLRSAYLAYYEQYGDGTSGYRYLDRRSGEAVESLDRSNGKIISKAGYGILQLEKADLPTLNGKPLTSAELEPVSAAECNIAGGSYRLRAFTPAAEKVLAPDRTYDRMVSFGYSILENDTVGESKTDRLYLNVNYGAALSGKTLPASESEPLEIRTAEQLQRMTGTKMCYFKQTHSILASNSTGMLENLGYHFDGGYLAGGAANLTYAGVTNMEKVGGNGNYIFGLTQPLFGKNLGVLKNIALLGVNLSSSAPDGTAALTLENIGDIQNCFAKGSVTATAQGAQAAGLVLKNSKSIERVYFSGSVTSAQGDAAGLVGENAANGGSIRDAYSAGSVSAANETASGLVSGNEGTVTRCYSIAEIKGDSAYGISEESPAVSECYWLKSEKFNDTVKKGAGASIKSADLKKKDMGSAWTADNAAHSYPDKNTGDFPYPRLTALDHYGDWPVMERTGRVGAVVEWYTTQYVGYPVYDFVYTYYLKGQLIDLTDLAKPSQSLDAQGYPSQPRIPVILLETTEVITNWTATFDGDPYTLEAYDQPFENLPAGMKAYELKNAGLRNNKNLVLTDRLSGNSYTFKYKNSNFTYTK